MKKIYSLLEVSFAINVINITNYKYFELHMYRYIVKLKQKKHYYKNLRNNMLLD